MYYRSEALLGPAMGREFEFSQKQGGPKKIGEVPHFARGIDLESLVYRKGKKDDLQKLTSFSQGLNLNALDSISGAAIGNNRIFLAITPMCNYYHALYMRLISGKEDYLQPQRRLHNDDDREETTFDHTKGQSSDLEDKYYGHVVTLPIHNKSPTPGWNSFFQLHKKLRMKVYDGEFTDSPFSVFAAWGFWRYYTGQSLDPRMFRLDQRRKWRVESLERCLITVGELSGERARALDLRITSNPDLTLSQAPKGQACNFAFGCPQNLPEDEARYARRLGWEHEHTRPKALGGEDLVDSASMCPIHNKIKMTNITLDLLTMFNILTNGSFLCGEG